jgi:hypothetical protein
MRNAPSVRPQPRSDNANRWTNVSRYFTFGVHSRKPGSPSSFHAPRYFSNGGCRPSRFVPNG